MTDRRPPIDRAADIARSIPKDIAQISQRKFRAEFIRRLRLRGWRVEYGKMLWRGSAGDQSDRRARLDMIAYPPIVNPDDMPDMIPEHQEAIPILIEIERNNISYRTRLKLQHWRNTGRPSQGSLIIVLYRPIEAVHTAPEATRIIALAHFHRRNMDIIE